MCLISRLYLQQQGHCDYPLTELGTSQAETVGENLDFIPWQQVYSSDLTRAHNTTKLLLSKSRVGEADHSLILSESIREIAYGVREGLSRRFSAAEAKVEYARLNNMKVEDVIDTAETQDQVKSRQKDFILQILQDYLKEHPNGAVSFKEVPSPSSSSSRFHPQNTPILCVSHGGYIKLFLKTYCGLVLEKSLGNCSVSIVTIEWPDVNEPLIFKCTSSVERVDMAPQQS